MLSSHGPSTQSAPLPQLSGTGSAPLLHEFPRARSHQSLIQVRPVPLLDSGIAAKPPQALQLWFSRAAMFCFYSAFFVQRAIIVEYILIRSCAEAFGAVACNSDPAHKQDDHVQDVAAVRTTWIATSTYVLSIATTACLTAASDACGRKPVLFATAGALLLSAIGNVVISYMGWDDWWMVVPALLSGTCGSFATFNAVLFAFTADICTNAKMRSHAFSILEGSLFLGGTFAPVLGGYLLQAVSGAAAFALTCALFAAAIVFVSLLRESVDGASIGRLRHYNFCCMALSSLRLLGYTGGERGGSSICCICTVFVICFAATTGVSVIAPLFTAKAFGMGPESYSLLFACNYGSVALTLLVLLPAVLALAPRRPLSVLVWGIRFGALMQCTSVLFGVATSTWQVFVIYAAFSLSSPIFPTVRALLSALVGPHEQGRALGLVAIIEGATATLDPIAWGYLYDTTVASMPSFVFFVICGTSCLGFLGSLCLRPPRPSPRQLTLDPLAVPIES